MSINSSTKIEKYKKNSANCVEFVEMDGLMRQSDSVAKNILRKIEIIAKYKTSSGVIWLKC